MNPASEVLLDHAPLEVKQAWLQKIRWRLTAHPFQIPPEGTWRGWMLQAGRGAGKTRTGAQDAVEQALDTPGLRYAVVAPTQGDVRATCFEGDSGIIRVLTEMGVSYDWQKSILELDLPNGSKILGYSAEKPDRLRGPQFHRAWCDEMAAWRDAPLGDALNTTFNNLSMGLRLGDTARMLVTTTPKRVALIRELVTRPDFVVTRGTTYDNIKNLSSNFAESILRYEGTMIGRQEIHGELIDKVEGALWTGEQIDASRFPPEIGLKLGRAVVGVDPPGGATECGIVAAGIISGLCPCGDTTNLPHGVVISDDSLFPTGPNHWASVAINVYHDRKLDKLVAEANYGGDMVLNTIANMDNTVHRDKVNASRGKILRAEPIAGLYGDPANEETWAKSRIHHVGYFPELEGEMTSYTQADAGSWSPNRLDAMVWALTELGFGTYSAATISSRATERRI